MALYYWNENCERCEVFHWFQRKYLTTKKQDRVGDSLMWTSHKPEAWGLGFRCIFGALGSWPSPVIPKLWSSQWEISKIVNVPSLVNCPPFPLFPSWDPRLEEDQGVDSGGLFTLSVRVSTPLGESWRSTIKLRGNVYLCEWGPPWLNSLYSIFSFFNLAESIANHELRTAEHLKLEWFN